MKEDHDMLGAREIVDLVPPEPQLEEVGRDIFLVAFYEAMGNCIYQQSAYVHTMQRYDERRDVGSIVL